MSNPLTIDRLMWTAQHRSGSEVYAGGRALLDPSPLHRALSTVTGRMAARTLVAVGLPSAAQNFVGARIPVIVYLAREHVPAARTMPTTVDAFASYSTIGYQLATAFPGGLHIDFASSELVFELRGRLQKSGVMLPPNYRVQAVDYREQSIVDVLGRKADVIIANSTFYTWEENIIVLRHLRQALRPGGVVLTSAAYVPVVLEVQRSLRFFKSQVGQFPLTFERENQLHDLLLAAGYMKAQVYRASALAQAIGLRAPIMDLELFGVGYTPHS